jgi:hypothetical protein
MVTARASRGYACRLLPEESSALAALGGVLNLPPLPTLHDYCAKSESRLG